MSFVGSDGTFFPNSIESELEFIIKTTEFRHTKGVAEECLNLLRAKDEKIERLKLTK